MAMKIPGLNWLNCRDEAQLTWAIAYLRRRGTKSLFGLFEVTHSDLLAAGKELESSARGLITLNAMKNAWRQKQYRGGKNGRQARTFSLPSTSLTALSCLAKSNDLDDTSQLKILIEQADETRCAAQTNSKQPTAKEKAARKDERQKSARYKIQLNVAMEHLERCLMVLAKWELSMAEVQPPFNGDEAEAEKLAKEKLDQVRRDIRKATLRLDIATPRAGM